MIYIYLIPLWWLIGEFIGYIVHLLMHRLYVPEHEEHHMTLYPPDNFLSRKYREPSGKSSWLQDIRYTIPALVFIPLIVFFLNWQHAVIFSVIALSLGFFNQWIHNAMHVRYHWLGNIRYLNRWFYWARKRHFIHHVELHRNLGMYHFVWDTALGSKEKVLRVNWKENSPWAERENERKSSLS